MQAVHAPVLGVAISIHALREEGDLSSTTPLCTGWIFLSTPSARRATVDHSEIVSEALNFYPRPPRGGRQYLSIHLQISIKFLSTPSARRATLLYSPQIEGQTYFYPRPPRGGRRPLRTGHD